MRVLRNISLFAVLTLLLCGEAFAQGTESKPRDGAYDKTINKDKGLLAYDHLREADVFWQKRVWRVIDTREKRNKIFTYPKEPFIDILLGYIETGETRVYGGIDDGFDGEPITPDELFQSISGGVDTIEVYNPDTDMMDVTIINNEFNPEDVKKFRLKEDWIFDEEAARMVCRVIGIAPVIDSKDEFGNIRGEQVLFWAYYPDFRPLLAKHESFNMYNDASHMTWEDVFEARLFNSYVYKESNVYDRRVQDYTEGVDALYESERIKEKIINFEQDLWSY